MQSPPPPVGQAGRQPILNAPPLAVALALSMPALYLLQERMPELARQGAFYTRDLDDGRWTGLFTAMLLHQGWAHVAMNALGALTFAAPVARLMRGGRGVAAFFFLYVLCGVMAALGFGLVHRGEDIGMVGASGAVFGLIGASTRLIGTRGWVRPLFDRQVLTMAAAWMMVNAAFGLIGFAPGAGGAAIAWEAHAFGFVTGILVIGPLGRMFTRDMFASGPDLSDPVG